MTRRPLIILSVLLVALLWASPVAAGNWATAHMDEPARPPVADQEATFGFVVLQHGVTPASWVTATFVATSLATGEQVQAPMRAVDADGRFVTNVTFPDAGDWSWYVSLAELGTDQEGAGGTLTVAEPESATSGLGALARRIGAALVRWLADTEPGTATTS